MDTINIHQAKTHLSRLVERAEKGESMIIARAGKPAAMLVPVEPEPRKGPRRIGFMEGEIDIPDDFKDIAREEIEAMFYGSD